MNESVFERSAFEKCYCDTPEHKSKMKKTLEDLLKNIRMVGRCSILGSCMKEKKKCLHITASTSLLKMTFWK